MEEVTIKRSSYGDGWVAQCGNTIARGATINEAIAKLDANFVIPAPNNPLNQQ